MSSSSLHLVNTLFLLFVGHAASGATFSPHEYGCSRFRNYLGPQQDWEADLAPAFSQNSFTVVMHGVAGAGKSSLTKMLCGPHEALLVGPKDLDDNSGIRSVSDQAVEYSCRSRSPTDSATIYVIDTPGFQEPNLVGQLQTLKGVDRAHELARGMSIPLMRIYFLLDWTDHTTPIPHNLRGYLLLLLYRYGSAISSRIRFIISKCDRIQSLAIPEIRIRQLMTKLSQCYQDVFDHGLTVNDIIFVSAHPYNLQHRTIRHLTKDLVRASQERMFVLRRDARLDEKLPHMTSLLKLKAQVTGIQELFGLNSVLVPHVGDNYESLLHLRRDITELDQAARSTLSLLKIFVFEQKQKVYDQELTAKVFSSSGKALSLAGCGGVPFAKAAGAVFKGISYGCDWGSKSNAAVLKEAEDSADKLQDCLQSLERDLALMCGCSSQD